MSPLKPLPPVEVHPTGPQTADILIVGEAPGAQESATGQPFVGTSGQELTKMLEAAGISRAECRITNVVPWRPEGNKIENFFLNKTNGRKANAPHILGAYCQWQVVEGLRLLADEIASTRPRLIIALGNTALWALTGLSDISQTGAPTGIGKWRGSMLYTRPDLTPARIKVLPTYHPAGVMRMWSWRPTAIHDLRRAAQYALTKWPEPDYEFTVRPTYSQAHAGLRRLLISLNNSNHPVPLAVDLETSRGHIDCIGIASSPTRALCIPFMEDAKPEGYWTEPEELELVSMIREILHHPNAQLVGQNFIYDLQYLTRRWFIQPRCHFDTMVAQHVCFPGTPRGLDYLSSMYCEYHRYWKEEGKHKSPDASPEQHWTYNCRDACATFEVHATLDTVISRLGKREQFDYLMALFDPVMDMILRGVRIDTGRRSDLQLEVFNAQAECESKLLSYIPDRYIGVKKPTKHTAHWYDSPIQLRHLLYTEIRLPPVLDPKTKRPTTEDGALKQIEERHPILYPVLSQIRFRRSLGVFSANFLQAGVDSDSRMRTQFNIAGPETFRFSSNVNALGGGTNMQNIPNRERREKDPILKALPDIREMFIPDPGYTLLEYDLDRADAQVVAWEADDTELKQMFREGADIHTENAKAIWGTVDPSKRYLAKMGVHAVNYGAYPKRLAHALGLTLAEAEAFRNRWLDAHPAIRKWHSRIEYQLQTRRTVTNAFGFHRIYFDRPDNLLKDGLAWIPQSTVGIAINKGMLNLWQARHTLPVQLLLQIHDSLVIQVPTVDCTPQLRDRIRQHLEVPIPYDDPLTIPVSCKLSPASWAHCKEPKAA